METYVPFFIYLVRCVLARKIFGTYIVDKMRHIFYTIIDFFFGHYPPSCFYLKTAFRRLDSSPFSGKSLFTRSSQQSPVSETFQNETGRWIMSKKSIIVLIYHCQKCLNLSYILCLMYFPSSLLGPGRFFSFVILRQSVGILGRRKAATYTQDSTNID
jgi:hypothetical protein